MKANKDSSIPESFKAGEYYIGDLCYVFNEDSWEAIMEVSNLKGGSSYPLKDKTFWFDFTAYGDGSFKGTDGFIYGVDSGSIGIVSVSIIDKKKDISFGRIVTFPKDFVVANFDGVFHFGEISIDTN